MNYDMPNRALRLKALRTVYAQSKKAAADSAAQLQWLKASIWNVWAVFREYQRLERAQAV